MNSQVDPFAAIANETPSFSDDEAIAHVRSQYGMRVKVRTLVSERDQNFELRSEDGHKYVLKIASAAEPREVTDFQIEALLHIERYIAANSTPIVAPSIRKTVDGASHTILRGADSEHVARVVSYVQGVPIGEREMSARLSRATGVYLAHLGCALQDFEHAGGQQQLLWDLQRALSLRDLLDHIPADTVRQDVVAALDDFEEFAVPAFATTRRQVVHSDFNPDNVLADPVDSDKVVGVIDFGDMLEAPLVADVAIGASYARPMKGDPLVLIGEFLAGYHSITPLMDQEIDILFELIKARLCASVALLYWRASFREAGDPYLEKLLNAETFAEQFLARLSDIPRREAIRCFRRAVNGDRRD